MNNKDLFLLPDNLIKEPYQQKSIVAGKRILGHEQKLTECKRVRQNGTVNKWIAKSYIYEAECIVCGHIAKIGSSAMSKRIKESTIHCKKCSVHIPEGGSSIDEIEAIQVDDLMPKPPEVLINNDYHWYRMEDYHA